MELLVCVVNDPQKVDDILQAFLEIGITGATIIDSYGMGKALLQDIPIFAGFRNMLAGTGSYNKTIFSIIENEEKANQAIAAIDSICGDLMDPATGLVFTIPVRTVKGLRLDSM